MCVGGKITDLHAWGGGDVGDHSLVDKTRRWTRSAARPRAIQPFSHSGVQIL